MRLFCSGLAALLLLLVPLAAQRPKTAADALARFAKVRDAAEGERRRAAGDLGDFADPEATAVLLAELARAVDPAYRQVVVRALGERLRPDAAVVAALRNLLRETEPARLLELAAEGLGRQGAPGTAALAETLAAARSPGALRSAVCAGLGIAGDDAARDLLLHEVRTRSGRDRLPALEALAARANDAAVDSERLQLARDKDVLVAATALGQLADHRHAEAPALALELSRRLDARATDAQRLAVLRGLLQRVLPAHFEPILHNATAGRDPFSKAMTAAWTAALGDDAFLQWLVQQGPQQKLAADRRTVAAILTFVPLPRRAEAAPALGKLLQQREVEVARAAALALAAFGPDLAAAPLQKLLTTGPEAVQGPALEALHEVRGADPAWVVDLLGHARGKSATLRTAALQLLARCGAGNPETLQAAGDNLDHKAWQVRAAAIDLIEALRQPAGIPWLIERHDVEQARLREDVAAALFALTRLRFPDAPTWRAWWQREGPTFRVPAAAKPGEGRPGRDGGAATVVTYWDIPVRSDRVAFVVDVSGSMNQPFGTGGGTRLDEAKRQLVRVLGMLPARAKANVIAFGTATDAFAPALQTIDDKRRKAAEAWTQTLAIRGATNVHAGLQRAFADADVDTIFLLTDGQPSAGPITAPDALAKEVVGWNLGRGIRIHTVALGGRSDLLAQLARDSGGEHTVAN